MKKRIIVIIMAAAPLIHGIAQVKRMILLPPGMGQCIEMIPMPHGITP
jgi:hypothetical protein